MTGTERMNMDLAIEFVNNGFESMTDTGKTVFAKTCMDLGIEVNTPVTGVEFERLSEVIIKKMEEEEMVDTTAATREEVEVTLGNKAKEFAEAAKEKLEKGFEFAVENIDSVKEEVIGMANMSPDVLENYLKNNGKRKIRKLIDNILEFASKERDNAKAFPFFADVNIKNAEKSESLVRLIKDVIDDENKSGWGKFVSVVKELAKWILKLLLKVGVIVLKIAFTVVVGAIKIGAATLVSAGAVADVTYREVIKPVFKGGKKVIKKTKEKIADIKDAMCDCEEFDEEEFENEIFEDEDELAVVNEQ